MTIKSSRPGFTLIELFLVIGIIAILAAIVIVAINPAQDFGEARDAQRKSDVDKITTAIQQYLITHDALPTTITTTPRPICQADFAAEECLTAINGVSLNELIGDYTDTIPKDPQVLATGTGTRYNIWRDEKGRVTVTAPGAEGDAEITSSR